MVITFDPTCLALTDEERKLVLMSLDCFRRQLLSIQQQDSEIKESVAKLETLINGFEGKSNEK